MTFPRQIQTALLNPLRSTGTEQKTRNYAWCEAHLWSCSRVRLSHTTGRRSAYLPTSYPSIPIQWGEDTHFLLACWSAPESVAKEEVQAWAHCEPHSLLASCCLTFDFGELTCSQKMPGHSQGSSRDCPQRATCSGTWGHFHCMHLDADRARKQLLDHFTC